MLRHLCAVRRRDARFPARTSSSQLGALLRFSHRQLPRHLPQEFSGHDVNGVYLGSYLLVTDLGARSSPAAAKRCAEGAGLEGAPKSVTSSKRSQIFSTHALLRLFEVWLYSDPRRFRSKASPLPACSTRRTNLYPAGFNPFHNPSCALRGRGLQGGRDLSPPRRISALSSTGHTSTLDLISVCSSPLEDGTSRHQAGF